MKNWAIKAGAKQQQKNYLEKQNTFLARKWQCSHDKKWCVILL